MAESSRELVVVMTHGADHELSSVAFTIANGGMTTGLKVSVFLTSAAVDLVRKKGTDSTVVPPLEPLATLVADFLKRGGRLMAIVGDTPVMRATLVTRVGAAEFQTTQGWDTVAPRLLNFPEHPRFNF